MTTDTKQPTCEQRIEARMADRLEQFAPDFDAMSAPKCKDILDDEADSSSYPDESNPWTMDRAAVIEALEGLGTACFDEESDDLLREALLESCNDSGDWGDPDDWRTATREHWQDHIGEKVLSIEPSKVYKVCMSWGGPADYFELAHDGEGWSGGAYIFQDWYDGARRSLTAEQAEMIADTLAIGPDHE